MMLTNITVSMFVGSVCASVLMVLFKTTSVKNAAISSGFVAIIALLIFMIGKI